MTSKKLIVGLGNPTAKHMYNRHNIGRLALQYFKFKNCHGNEINHITFECNVPEGTDPMEFPKEYEYYQFNDLICFMSNTYMNSTGFAVKDITNWFGIDDTKNILVIVDDIALPFGKLRLRGSGSSGKHKGLQSIIDQLNTENIARLRVGIDRPKTKDITLYDYVLSNFELNEIIQFNDIFENILSAINIWCQKDIDSAMTEINK